MRSGESGGDDAVPRPYVYGPIPSQPPRAVPGGGSGHSLGVPEDSVMGGALALRPCTVDDIVAGLSMDQSAVAPVVENLVRTGEITKVTCGGEMYYRFAGGPDPRWGLAASLSVEKLA